MTWKVRQLTPQNAPPDDEDLDFTSGRNPEISRRIPISRNLRRLEIYMQPATGWDVVQTDGRVRCSCQVWVRNCICVHSIAVCCRIGQIPPGMQGAPRKYETERIAQDNAIMETTNLERATNADVLGSIVVPCMQSSKFFISIFIP